MSQSIVSRIRASKWLPILIVLLALTGLIVSFQLWSNKSNSGQQWVDISRPVEDKLILLSGLIEGADTSLVRAPFESIVKQSYVGVGDHVNAGDKLIELDTSTLQFQLLEAKEALIKSEIAYKEANTWRDSPSYRAMQRQKRGDDDALKLAEQKLNESQRLYQAGIISREEFSQGQQAVQSARSQLQSSIDNLEATERKASSESIQLAQLDLQKQRARFTQLQQKIAQAKIHASITGVVTQIGVRSGSAMGDTQQERFSEGAVLAKIVNVSNFMLVGAASEDIVDRLKVGMVASVRPNSYPNTSLQGVISKISGLPISNTSKNDNSQENRGAKFNVYVKLNAASGNETVTLMLGTSAQISVSTNETAMDDLLVVPLSSVHSHAGKPSIVVRLSKSPDIDMVKNVSIIDTLVDAIVIKADGMAVGDKVLSNPRRGLMNQATPYSNIFAK